MKLGDDVPKPVTWIARAVGYGIGLLVVVGLVLSIGNRNLANNTMQCMEDPGAFNDKMSALWNAQAMGACLARKNGFLEDLLLGPIQKTLRALPNAPCRYVGVWNSFQPQCSYSLSLDSIGTFAAEPLDCNISSASFSGSWGVHKNQIVWIYDQGRRWPPEVNPIQDVDADSFILTERNGSRTVFKRISTLPSRLCP